MGVKRYELSEAQWTRIAPLLPGKATDPGRTAADIERCFNKLKHFRRFATRYDRRTVHFLAFIHLAAVMLWLR